MLDRTHARWALMAGLLVLIASTGLADDETVRGPSRTFAGNLAMLDGDIPYWANKEYVDRALHRLKEAGFNVYMPTVWQGRGTAWPSRYAPWDVQLKDHPKSDFDPLRYAIAKAHELGIEVHPWFTLTLRQSDIFPEFAPPGSPEGAFDVHHEGFRRLMANLVAEVVENYDVDGINLDYVRAMGLCKSARCTLEYRQRYGRSLQLDTTAFNLTFGQVPTLVDYQESAVTAMVKGISEKIRRRKPNLLISVDAIPGQSSPEQGQASVEWVNEGLVDVILRMDYFPRLNIGVTESVRAKLLNPDRLSLLICNMATEEELTAPDQPRFPRSGKWLAETASMIRSRWPHTGLAVYFYKYLSDDQIAALRAGPFRMSQDGLKRPIGPSVQ